MDQLIKKAIIKATELHAGQTRKGDGSPYISHPLEVGFIVSRYTNRNSYIAAAILHDTIEDCEYTQDELQQEFGEEISAIVSALTEDKSREDWSSRKLENLSRIEGLNAALFIKAADALSNMRSLVAALQTNGESIWSKFKAPKAIQILYFKDILSRGINVLPSGLVAEYVEALKDLEYSDAYVPRGIGFNAPVAA